MKHVPARFAVPALTITLITLTLSGCVSPQPLPVEPTPIPTLAPATLPSVSVAEETPEAVGVRFPAEQPSVENARAIYLDQCTDCHGEDGAGLVPGARNFGDFDYLRGQTPVKLYQVITEGRGEMPAYLDTLSDQERWDLTFLVLSFAIPDGALEEGETIYYEHCAACHGDDGSGLVPGSPDFTSLPWVASRPATEFFEVVTAGRGAMPAWQGRLTPDERWAAIEFMRAFAYQPHER